MCVHESECTDAAVNGLVSSIPPFYFILAGWGILALFVLCCLCFFLFRKRKKKPEQEQEKPELSKQEIKQLEKMEQQNIQLKKKIDELAEKNAQNDAVIEKVDDFEEIQENNERLKEENRRLQDVQNQIQQQVIIESSEESGPPGPISLVLSGGGFLQERTILAQPTMPMSRILEIFCSESPTPMRRDDYEFYNRDTGKKLAVDGSKTAQENGFTNGSRILIEKVSI